MKRGTLLRVVVMDENPLHVDAFRKIAEEAGSLDLIECGTVDHVQGLERAPDLILMNVCFNITQCPNHILLDLQKCVPGAFIVCYASTRLAQGLIHKREERTMVLSNDDMMPALRDFAVTQNFKGFLDCALTEADEVASGRSELLYRLTGRELEVFCLSGKGLGSPEIARELDLQRNTVESHLKNIRMKMGYSGVRVLRSEARSQVRTNSCRVFLREDDHICPHSGESIGLCGSWHRLAAQ